VETERIIKAETKKTLLEEKNIFFLEKKTEFFVLFVFLLRRCRHLMTDESFGLFVLLKIEQDFLVFKN
jgi:hypothetical protein